MKVDTEQHLPEELEELEELDEKLDEEREEDEKLVDPDAVLPDEIGISLDLLPTLQQANPWKSTEKKRGKRCL